MDNFAANVMVRVFKNGLPSIFGDFLHYMINSGIFCGFTLGALVLLRPALWRIFTAQQRVVLWYFCCGICLIGIIFSPFDFGLRLFLPNALQLPVYWKDLVLPASWQEVWMDLYSRAFHLDWAAYIDLSNLHLLGAAYVLSVIAVEYWLMKQAPPIKELEKAGTQIPLDDPWILENSNNMYYPLPEGVYVVEGIETSFVTRDKRIFLQKGLPDSRFYPIFLHEMEHIRLWHVWFKWMFTRVIVLFWWNPLFWLGFRYMIQDMELASDSAVLSKLKPEERTEYARTLVDLGSGRQMWTTPNCFGECDAAVRVNAAVKWKPQGKLLQGVRVALVAVMVLFFLG